MSDQKVLAMAANWRVVQDAGVGPRYAEVLGLVYEGYWWFPDCSYYCRYCGDCLGCLKRRVFEEDEYGNVFLRKSVIRCKESPTGLHACLTDDDMEESDRLLDIGCEEFDRGRFSEAKEKFQDAIDLHPYPVGAYLSLGHALEIEGDLPGAVRAYRNALSCDPTDLAEVHLILGTALQNQRKYPEALEHLRACVKESKEPQMTEAAREAIRAIKLFQHG